MTRGERVESAQLNHPVSETWTSGQDYIVLGATAEGFMRGVERMMCWITELISVLRGKQLMNPSRHRRDEVVGNISAEVR